MGETMKTFLKYFSITFIIFAIGFTSILWWYDEMLESAALPNQPDIEIETEEPNIESPYQELYDASDRINFLVLGLEDFRTDTIMFASYEPNLKTVDIISIPRDTYHVRNENHSADLKKINSVYGGDGIIGVEYAVSEVLLGAPIDYFVTVNYSGVSKVVDSLDGVEVYVPMDMKYDDVWDEPPLHIDIEKGLQTLNGEKSVEFLRFRKNNDGTGYPDGDLGRIRAQQGFIEAAFDKVLSYRLPIVANTVVKYVKTDIPLKDLTLLATGAIGMSGSDITTHSLPGDAVYSGGVSYYLHDPEKTSALIESLYE